MLDMPRPRPPHLHCETNRHGKRVWYVRVGKGPRIRIRAALGSDEFNAEYQAAVTGAPICSSAKIGSDTLAWLIARYRDSSAWSSLSPATRRQRENIFKQVIKTAGTTPYRLIVRKTIVDGRERRSKTPFQARHFVDAMRGLFKWAVEAEHLTVNPTDGVKVKKPKSAGFPPWTEDDVKLYEKRWPLGTRERVMLDVFLYTGLRRGDASVVGKQHVRNIVPKGTRGPPRKVISITTEKTGTLVTIPMLAVLEKTLNVGPIGDLAFIASHSGAPLTKETLGNFFHEACRKAKIEKSAHGLRKFAATLAANRGATVAELEAIFGWEGGRMASHYTKNADREALAAGAIKKLSR